MVNYIQSPLLASLRGLTPEPSADVRQELCAKLIAGLDQYYVHLPQKRAAFAIDPVQELRLLQGSDGTGFLRSLIQTVSGLHDRHTTLKLAEPWTSLIAYVPFVLERFFEGGRPKYVLTKQLFGFEDLPIGAEITHWNGTPIERYAAGLSTENQGANAGARMQLAVANLSIRPLAFMLLPQEDWVTLSYLRVDGTPSAISTPWRFYSTATRPGASIVNAGMALAGIDEMTDVSNRFRLGARSDAVQRRDDAQPLQVELNGQLRFGELPGGKREVGYIRLTTFDVPDATAFARRMAAILADLPQDRLIIDIRSNPGGLIPAGQKFIRLLKKGDISPSPIAFRSTASTLVFGRIPQFAAWGPSLDILWSTGQIFSQAIAVTTYEDVPDYRYPGKIGLIIDGLCYSTSDFFTADFRDNAVGTIIGVDAATGGGGANVWGWNLLAQFLGPYGPGVLPQGYDFNISMRRSLRTGAAAGIPVEDLGVPADVIHQMTRADILEDNRDLLAFAIAQVS
jgi:hypothetical protein